MPPKKKHPKKRPPKPNSSKRKPSESPSHKTDKPASQSRTLAFSLAGGASGRGTPSKPTTKQKKSGNIGTSTQAKYHTRRSRGSPLWEKRDDVEKIGFRPRQKLKKSTPAIKSKTEVKPRSERHQEQDTLPPDQPIASIETPFATGPEPPPGRQQLYSLSPTPQGSDESTDSEILPWLKDLPYVGEASLQRSGYVVPLSDKALAAIFHVLGREAAITMASIKPGTTEFETALEVDRNVCVEESERDDAELTALESYQPREEADQGLVAAFLENLWLADLRFCENQQEPLFQRTVMMSMISRHRLIFDPEKTVEKAAKSTLMFSVEAVWTYKWARAQALNDASQALHNLHEFFKEAEQTSVFFDRVRVFSATASQKGVILRVHWAEELPADNEATSDRVDPDYPLCFKYQNFKSFRDKEFERSKVNEAFERIMIGYGQNQLFGLLKEAAGKLKAKCKRAYTDPKNYKSHFNDYRYGQSGKPGARGKRPTSAVTGTSRPATSTPIRPPSPHESRQKSGTAAMTRAIGQGTAGFQIHDLDDPQGTKGARKRTRGASPARPRKAARQKE
ncbi:MAG: hypothetical protein Q9227_009057 [Pyrenula ochraceoflavens]